MPPSARRCSAARSKAKSTAAAEKIQELLAELQKPARRGTNRQGRAATFTRSIIHDINGPLTVISGFVQLLNQRLNRTTRMEAGGFGVHQGADPHHRAAGRAIASRFPGVTSVFSAGKPTQTAPRMSVNQLLTIWSSSCASHPSLQENEFSLTPVQRRCRRQDQRHGSDPDFAEPRGQRASMRAARRTASRSAAKCCAQPLDLTQIKDGPHDRLLNIESLENTAPLVKFWVRDTGPGIPPEVLPKIFQPYFTTKGPRARHRPRPQHRPAAHQGRQRRAARATPSPAKARLSRFICRARNWRSNSSSKK